MILMSIKLKQLIQDTLFVEVEQPLSSKIIKIKLLQLLDLEDISKMGMFKRVRLKLNRHIHSQKV
jgi:hypothetical protein